MKELLIILALSTITSFGQDLFDIKMLQGLSMFEDAIKLMGQPEDSTYEERNEYTTMERIEYKYYSKGVSIATLKGDKFNTIKRIRLLKPFSDTLFNLLYIGMSEYNPREICDRFFVYKGDIGSSYFYTAGKYCLRLDVSVDSGLTMIELNRFYKYNIELYGNEYGILIDNNVIAIGMTKEMVISSFGKPDDINRTVTQYGINEQWVYESRDMYLYFEEGILTSWQD